MNAAPREATIGGRSAAAATAPNMSHTPAQATPMETHARAARATARQQQKISEATNKWSMLAIHFTGWCREKTC
jgi:hypothetical protein